MSFDDGTLLYSKEDHKRVTSLFSVQIRYLKANAQYPRRLLAELSTPWQFIGQILIYFHGLFLIFLHFHLVVLHLKLTYDKFYDGRLEDITDALIMVIIYAFSCFSTAYFMWYAKPLSRFLERISLNYRHHSLAGLTFVSSFTSYDRARKMMIMWASACHSGVLLWGFAPIIMRSHTLPLKCWYPFDEMQPGVYEWVYLSQLLGQVFVGFSFANTSALYVSLVIVILGQFDVLFCSLKNYEYNALLKSGKDIHKLRKLQKEIPMGQNDELNQYSFSTEYKTDLTVYATLMRKTRNSGDRINEKSYKEHLHAALVDCFEHHHFIIDCCRQMEELFNPFCLIKSLQITFQLCLLMFVGVVGERTPLRIINFIQYSTLTFMEIFLYTYFGELLRRHSLRGGEALWRSPWWRNATLVRKDLMIFLLNSRRAVKLTAGKFFAMDIDRFRSVLTQAFSFLTLLQKLAAKNAK